MHLSSRNLIFFLPFTHRLPKNTSHNIYLLGFHSPPHYQSRSLSELHVAYIWVSLFATCHRRRKHEGNGGFCPQTLKVTGALPPKIWDLPILRCFSQDLYVSSKPSLASDRICRFSVSRHSSYIQYTSLRSSNNEKNSGNHHTSCSKLCLLCVLNYVKNLTIIAKC